MQISKIWEGIKKIGHFLSFFLNTLISFTFPFHHRIFYIKNFHRRLRIRSLWCFLRIFTKWKPFLFFWKIFLLFCRVIFWLKIWILNSSNRGDWAISRLYSWFVNKFFFKSLVLFEVIVIINPLLRLIVNLALSPNQRYLMIFHFAIF